MKLGIQIPFSKGWKVGKNITIDILLPATTLGYFEYVDMLPESNWDDDSKWFGFKLNLMTNISFESYDYGKIFTFGILGLGFRISKYITEI
jgi:hypothetical protein